MEELGPKNQRERENGQTIFFFEEILEFITFLQGHPSGLGQTVVTGG